MKPRTKPVIAITAAALALSSGALMADYSHEFRDRAKVVSSTPVYEQVNEPRRECHTEYRSYEEKAYRNSNNTAGAILGVIFPVIPGGPIGGALIGAALSAFF